MEVLKDKGMRALLIASNIKFDKAFAITCLLLLYKQQTKDEQNADATLHQNGVGFNSTDSRLSIYARDILDGFEPKDFQIEEIQGRLVKYSKQLETLLPDDEF